MPSAIDLYSQVNHLIDTAETLRDYIESWARSQPSSAAIDLARSQFDVLEKEVEVFKHNLGRLV